MTKLVALLLLAALTIPAHAESQSAPPDLQRAAEWLLAVKRGRLVRFDGTALDRDAAGVTRCQAAIDKVRDDGASLLGADCFDAFGAANHELRLGQAESVCREAAFYHEVVLKDLALFQALAARPSAALVDRCTAAVDAMRAAKVSAALPFPLTRDVATVGDLEPTLCWKAREAGDRLAKLAAASALLRWLWSEPDDYLRARLGR